MKRFVLLFWQEAEHALLERVLPLLWTTGLVASAPVIASAMTPDVTFSTDISFSLGKLVARLLLVAAFSAAAQRLS